MLSATLRTLITSLFLTLIIHTSSTMAMAAPTLIEEVCNVTRVPFNTKLCITTLDALPSLAVATTLYDLTMGLIGTGAPLGQYISDHLKQELKKPNLPVPLHTTLNRCLVSYDSVIKSFEAALGYAKAKDYDNAANRLLSIMMNFMAPCVRSVKAYAIHDGILSMGNQDVEIFSLSAYQGATDLSKGKA